MGSSNKSQEENYQNTLSQDVRVAVASPRLAVGIVQPGGPIIPALRVGGKEDQEFRASLDLSLDCLRRVCGWGRGITLSMITRAECLINITFHYRNWRRMILFLIKIRSANVKSLIFNMCINDLSPSNYDF